jgi:predicted aspartyl protease
MTEEYPWYEAVRDAVRVKYKARLAKTPNRIQYAITQFQKYDIEFALKNETTGHFHCRRKFDNQLFQFYAGTGKIQGLENARGINALLEILTHETFS